ALSTLPGGSSPAMARGAQARDPCSAVLPRRLHRPRGSELLRSGCPAAVLRHSVPCRERESCGHRRRSATSRAAARLPRRAPHLGTDAHPAPAPALRRGRWRVLGWRRLLPSRTEPEVPPLGTCPLALLPAPLPRASRRGS